MNFPRRGAAVGVATSAVLYWAAFPPFSVAPLAWVALTPLLAAVVRLSPARAFGAGWAWGVLVCLATGWPLAGMIERAAGVPPIAAVGAMLFAASVLFALPIAVFTCWLSFVARRWTLGPLTVGAGWAACEFVRQHSALGIPWSLSGYSQLPLLPLVQIADLGGPFAIAFVLGAVNATLAGIVRPELRGTHSAVQRLAVVALLAFTVGYGLWRLERLAAPLENPIPIAVVQGNLRPGIDPADPLERYAELSLGAPRAELLFWPEFALDFVPRGFGEKRAALFELVRTTGSDLVTGGPWDELGEEEVFQWNAVFLFRPDGRQRYEKERPLLLTERDVFGIRDRLRRRSYTPGRETAPLAARTATVGVAICSEAMDPALVRARAAAGAEVLVNPSNDGWFDWPPARRHQLDIAVLRAVENRRWLVRPSTVGFTAVVAPTGEIAALAPTDEPAALGATIEARQDTTPYQRWGDLFSWVALLWTGLVALRALSLARES